MKHGQHSKVMSAPMMDREYRDRDDHSSLLRAAEVYSDRSRMAGARRQQRKQMKAFTLMDHAMKGRR